MVTIWSTATVTVVGADKWAPGEPVNSWQYATYSNGTRMPVSVAGERITLSLAP
jgi:hypothetical protein